MNRHKTEIERLRQENAFLRAALRRALTHAHAAHNETMRPVPDDQRISDLVSGTVRILRTAGVS